jgi:hypothetical protein
MNRDQARRLWRLLSELPSDQLYPLIVAAHKLIDCAHPLAAASRVDRRIVCNHCGALRIGRGPWVRPALVSRLEIATRKAQAKP